MATLVLGGSGGIGKEVMKHFPEAIDWSLKTAVDLAFTESISKVAMELVTLKATRFKRVINCAGTNALFPFDELKPYTLQDTMDCNAFALPWVIQALRANALIFDGAVICNVISNAAHVPMTHSLAYNASKAAQEMITRQMARELKEYVIFGVNPNKIAGTNMSLSIAERVCKLRGWTPEEAIKYQLAALPAGVETPAASLAAFIAELMKPIHHPYITGCIFPYGGP